MVTLHVVLTDELDVKGGGEFTGCHVKLNSPEVCHRAE
jgi:hypothetical protein